MTAADAGDVTTPGPGAPGDGGGDADMPGGARMVEWPGGSRQLLPDWLVNLAALGWRVIAIALLILVLWALANVLWTVTASIAVAVVISASFAPFALRLRARGRSRAAAAAIVWVVAIGVIGGVLVVLSILLLPYVAEVVTRIGDGLTELRTSLAGIDAPPIVANLVEAAVTFVRGMVSDAVSSFVASAGGVVTVLVLATFLVFFFLKDGDRAWIWIFQAVGDQKRERISAAGDDALMRVGGYLRGTTILSAIIALSDFVFMVVLGVPLAGPLAVLVFLSGYIPYFGGIITTGIILIVTLGVLGTWPAVVMIVLIAIRNSILSSFVRPAIYGRTVRIHPALVLIVLPAGLQLAGVIGLFAAVPVTAVILAVASAAVSLADPGPEPDLPALVPPWLDRVAQWSWRLLVALAFLALAVGVFLAVPLVVIPVVFAMIVAATLAPLVRVLVRRGRSRGQASAFAVGGGFLVVLAIMVITVISLVSQASELDLSIRSGADTANAAAGGTLGLGVAAVAGSARQVTAFLLSIADGVAAFVAIIVLSTLLAFYFLKDGPQLWARLTGSLRADATGAVNEAGTRAFDVLSGYMVGTGAISLVGAGSQLVIMLILGIPLALPIFVLSFFLCFIPYIGGFISTGLALLVTIAVGSPTDIAIMVVWTLVFNIVTGNIVTPLVYGKAVNLHPAVVLVAVPAGAAIGGMLGMFLVVPVIGVVATTWRTVLSIIGLPREPVTVAGPAASAVDDTPDERPATPAVEPPETAPAPG